MHYFFTSLRNLQVDLADDVIGLMPGLNITNSKRIKERILNERVTQAIGLIESQHILNSNNIIFYEFDDEYDFENLETDRYLIVILIWLEELLKNSWLIKDNSIDCDAAFLVQNIDKDAASWASNALMSKNTLATGEKEDIVFSRQELNALSYWHNLIESHLHNKKSLSTEFMLEKNFSRIGRGLNFIKSARSSKNLAYKLSHYCSAFETLLTTDTSELSHKLSERVAFFVEDVFPDKLDTFKDVKQAYNVRSKLTHGDSLSRNMIDKLPELSEKCDKYLRTVLFKIIDEDELLNIFEGSNEIVDEYFNKLIFK